MCHDVSPQALTRPRDRGNLIPGGPNAYGSRRLTIFTVTGSRGSRSAGPQSADLRGTPAGPHRPHGRTAWSTERACTSSWASTRTAGRTQGSAVPITESSAGLRWAGRRHSGEEPGCVSSKWIGGRRCRTVSSRHRGWRRPTAPIPLSGGLVVPPRRERYAVRPDRSRRSAATTRAPASRRCQ